VDEVGRRPLIYTGLRSWSSFATLDDAVSEVARCPVLVPEATPVLVVVPALGVSRSTLREVVSR
jgi:hypothetical protein